MSVTSPLPASFGTFLRPSADHESMEDLAAALNIRLHSGYRAGLRDFRGQNRLFDAIVDRVEAVPLRCEDQCSAKHYFDAFDVVRRYLGRIGRLVEVGVFTGGSSQVFAGLVEPMDLELDLVDVNASYLRFTYERIRRTFPEAARRVRLFHGDLATYVLRVLRDEPVTALVHHDGAHDFTQVVKDLCALSFVREKVRGVLLQDTHLRGRIRFCNFVDAAVYAVFGTGVRFEPLGIRYGAGSPALEPNPYEGNYFLQDAPEGMFVPFEGNHFRYPHPSMALEEFLHPALSGPWAP